MLTNAQRRATEKYQAKHKEQQKKYQAKSRARAFVKMATYEELIELKGLIEKRIVELKK